MARIFLVDDHPITQAGTSAVLQAAGHQIVGQGVDVKRALIDIWRVTPDIVVLDLRLGDVCGFDILTAIHQQQMPIKVIIFSMSTLPEDVGKALRGGAKGYVSKRSNGSQLINAVDAVMYGRRFLGDGVNDVALETLTADQDSYSKLSPRERQILLLVCMGKTSVAIGQELSLSPKTIETYRSRLMTKVGITELPALVRWAIRQRLIDP